MAEEPRDLRGIDWTETLPFVRLFSTFQRAASFWPMVLGFCCVTLTYTLGRALDSAWKSSDAGVLVTNEPSSSSRFPSGLVAPIDEIEAYVAYDSAGFEAWMQNARESLESARTSAEGMSADHGAQADDLSDEIDKRLDAALAAIDASESMKDEEKADKRAEVLRAADAIRLTLAGKDATVVASRQEIARAVVTLLAPIPGGDPSETADLQGSWTSLMTTHRMAAEAEKLEPHGPFISLLNYESRCFAAAIQGACAGRWGPSGSALSGEPSMIGSIFSAGKGVAWLITQRPCYAAFFTIGMLIIFSFFGGAICRITAVRITRDEALPIKAALDFAREKFSALFAAPLLPFGIFLIAWVLIFVGGAVAAIPVLEVIAGLFYGLTLIGGAVMAATLLAVVLGFHLMWPTIAVEASDAFDAVQRSAGYLVSRAWHVGFYSFVLLLYGAVSFVMVRLAAMLAMKLTHFASGAGMNLATSGETSTIGKLDAMWSMPAWGELPLLPSAGDAGFWGVFRIAPLTGSESIAAFLIALSVFVVVGLVGAFVVSFYFAGSTQMYLLLRRDVDAVDYDEIYYEEEDEKDFGHEIADPDREDAAPEEAADDSDSE